MIREAEDEGLLSGWRRNARAEKEKKKKNHSFPSFLFDTNNGMVRPTGVRLEFGLVLSQPEI
jgi:hypothetical protein